MKTSLRRLTNSIRRVDSLDATLVAGWLLMVAGLALVSIALALVIAGVTLMAGAFILDTPSEQ